jgi:site-specific DNA-cytosine methylase
MATLCAKDNEKLGSDQWVKEGKAIVGFKPSWWVRATSPDGRETIGTLRQRDYKGIGNDDLESGRGLAIEVKQVAQPIAVDCFNQTINEKTSQTMAILRLKQKECERLQCFPDDWTKIPYRNKPADQCPDGPRYKACGNSMAVPVMRWIGTRIQMIENYLNP